MPIKKTIFLITALLYITYTVFPLFADTFSIPVWLPSIATFIIMFVLYPRAYTNTTFYWFLGYATVLFIYWIAGRALTIGIGSIADNKKIIVEFAHILPAISIFSILAFLKDEGLNRKLFIWVAGVLFLSFIVAVPLMLRYNSLREAMYTEKHEELRIPGLPSYSLMHAYTLFLPVVCYSVRVFDGIKRVYSIIGLVIMCFVIYDTFVTTSLLMMVLIILFSILYTDKNRAVFWIVSFLVAILSLILYETGFFISLIDFVMPAFDGTAVESKLLDIKSSMMQGHITGSSITGRQDYHAISINSFFQNPIFGTSLVGGHSSLMDRLGGMGLFAGLPFIMISVSFIKRTSSFFMTRMAKYFFGVGCVVSLVYLYFKGNWGGENWLFFMVMMPLGLLVIERYRVQHNKH